MAFAGYIDVGQRFQSGQQAREAFDTRRARRSFNGAMDELQARIDAGEIQSQEELERERNRIERETGANLAAGVDTAGRGGALEQTRARQQARRAAGALGEGNTEGAMKLLTGEAAGTGNVEGAMSGRRAMLEARGVAAEAALPAGDRPGRAAARSGTLAQMAQEGGTFEGMDAAEQESLVLAQKSLEWADQQLSRPDLSPDDAVATVQSIVPMLSRFMPGVQVMTDEDGMPVINAPGMGATRVDSETMDMLRPLLQDPMALRNAYLEQQAAGRARLLEQEGANLEMMREMAQEALKSALGAEANLPAGVTIEGLSGGMAAAEAADIKIDSAPQPVPGLQGEYRMLTRGGDIIGYIGVSGGEPVDGSGQNLTGAGNRAPIYLIDETSGEIVAATPAQLRSHMVGVVGDRSRASAVADYITAISGMADAQRVFALDIADQLMQRVGAPGLQARGPRPAAQGGGQASAEGVSQDMQDFAAAFPGARVTSGRRTPERNAAVGGVENSYHLTGEALDIVPESPQQRAEMIAEAEARGFEVIPYPNGHLHIEPAGQRGTGAPRGRVTMSEPVAVGSASQRGAMAAATSAASAGAPGAQPPRPLSDQPGQLRPLPLVRQELAEIEAALEAARAEARPNVPFGSLPLRFNDRGPNSIAALTTLRRQLRDELGAIESRVQRDSGAALGRLDRGAQQAEAEARGLTLKNPELRARFNEVLRAQGALPE